jgi:hypothetical protein
MAQEMRFCGNARALLKFFGRWESGSFRTIFVEICGMPEGEKFLPPLNDFACIVRRIPSD